MSRKEKKKQPVIVVEGAPEWMVTFGDLMSLLLTFFVLLFSISEIKNEKVYDIVVAFRSQFDVDLDADSFLLEFDEVTEMLSDLSRNLPDKAQGQAGKSKDPIENPFGKHASIHRVKEDFHIDIEGSVLFEPGSSSLSVEGSRLIGEISRRLRGGYNRIRVVGFASPVEGGIDETTLAFQRSRAVQEVLVTPAPEETGIDPLRIEMSTRGSGDPLRYLEIIDPERQKARDRVVIILTPETVRELIEKRERLDELKLEQSR